MGGRASGSTRRSATAPRTRASIAIPTKTTVNTDHTPKKENSGVSTGRNREPTLRDSACRARGLLTRRSHSRCSSRSGTSRRKKSRLRVSRKTFTATIRGMKNNSAGAPREGAESSIASSGTASRPMRAHRMPRKNATPTPALPRHASVVPTSPAISATSASPTSTTVTPPTSQALPSLRPQSPSRKVSR